MRLAVARAPIASAIRKQSWPPCSQVTWRLTVRDASGKVLDTVDED
jgi:hypothetical protein